MDTGKGGGTKEGRPKVKGLGYWQLRGLDENVGILDMTTECQNLLWSIAQNPQRRHGLHDMETNLLHGFCAWKSHEKISGGTVAGLDKLLQKNDSTSEFFIMTVQELILMRTQLFSLKSKGNSSRRKRKRQDDGISSSSKRTRQLHRATTEPITLDLNPDQMLDIKSFSSGFTSLSSTQSTIEMKKECLKIDRTLERLRQVSSFGRQVAMESRFPELDEFLNREEEGENGDDIRQIYPKARVWVLMKFPSAKEQLQIRLSAEMSKKVTTLVEGKQHTKKESFSEPLFNSASTPMVRSHTIEVESPTWSWRPRPWRMPIRAATDIREQKPRYSLYPTSLSDFDFQEEAWEYTARSSRPQVQVETNLSETPVASGQVECSFLVCPVPDCGIHLFAFKDRKQWEHHLRIAHPFPQIWTCTAICHGQKLLEFSSAAHFEQHMKEEHAGSFDDSDLPELADACQKPYSCPLCLMRFKSNTTKDSWDQTVLDHFIQHFVEIDSTCLEWVPEYESIDRERPFDLWRGVTSSTLNDADRTVKNSWVLDHCSRM